MRKILTVIVAAAVLLGLVAAPASAIPVPRAVPPINGCDFSVEYPPFLSNGLAWSTSDNEAFHSPMLRAGNCRHVMVRSLTVYNAPACFWAMVKTYNENGTTRVRGSWLQFVGVGTTRDLRPTIDVGRLYRIYAYACEPFRDPHFPPGFAVYAR